MVTEPWAPAVMYSYMLHILYNSDSHACKDYYIQVNKSICLLIVQIEN